MELTKKEQKALTLKLEKTLFAVIEKEDFYANANALTLDLFGDLVKGVLSDCDGASGITDQQICTWHYQFLGNASLAYP